MHIIFVCIEFEFYLQRALEGDKMKNIKAELCIETYEAAKEAERLGFDSIEINSALVIGGLTPSYGLVKNISENISIEKICMVRNRPSGFNYTDHEFQAMLCELDILLQEKIDGISFGFLTEDFQVDKNKTKIFADRIKNAGKIAVFHRAFDNTCDPYRAVEDLIDLNIDRILTSGQCESAFDGRLLIKDLVDKYSNKIEFIVGSGVNENNVRALLDETCAEYVHSSCKMLYNDITTNNKISYSIFEGKSNSYIGLDSKIAERFIDEIKKYN